DIFTLKAKDIMNKNPKTVDPDVLAYDALALLREYSISQFIVKDNDTILGFIHIHDLINEGIVY
ncbi:MAG: CBS domain-containing protein, partial [Leadbetterella sp.]